MAEEEQFFVAVKNPDDFRKDLLTANKSVLQLLQRQEELNKIRTEKTEMMFRFSKIIKELHMLIDKLKKTVPASKLRGAPAEIIGKVENITRTASMQRTGTQNMKKEDISRLQKELEMIEQRLDKLDISK